MMSFHHRASLKHVGLYARYRRYVSVASSRLISKPGVHGSGVLGLHIFTTDLFHNGIVLDYVSYSFGRNYAWNVHSKH